MNAPLIEKIRQCPTLPTLPAVAIQVLDLAQKEQVDVSEIAGIISRDPALSSKILRTVNSSFYGRGRSVSTVTQALVILGLQSVKTLVLGFSLVSTLTTHKSKGFKHLTYWRRSIYAATAARCIGTRVGVLQQEECFLAALLMDIGMLVLDQVLGPQYGTICAQAASHGDLPALEAAALDLTHADVANLLAEIWKLPPLLSVPIAHHHHPADIADAPLRAIAEVVGLAGRCADVFIDESAAGSISDVRTFCRDRYQISEADCDAMLDEICNRTREVAPLFDIRIADAVSFDAVLKKAHEALVDLTLKSQQQTATLQERNRELQEQAATDRLTGLGNRGRFDEFLAEQFDLAVQSGKPMSLILLDIDHFKQVNDRHGHPAGDQVLKALAALLRAAARPQDLAARYGGEEMVLVLPQTARSAAVAIAESLRRAIGGCAISCGKTRLKITASFGVAAFEPGGPLSRPAHLLKVADLSLYAAKRAGRNRVRVFSLKPTTAPVATARASAL